MSLQEQTSHFADLDGTKVHYHQLGTGPALMLLHGSGPGASGWSNYSRNVESLAKHFRLIVPDYPGFGRSDMKPPDTPVPGWWATVMVSLLETLGIDRAHIVGNSMGGMIALKMALEYPKRVERMVLMGPGGGQPVFSPWPTPAIMNLVTFYDGSGPTPERVRAFISACVHDQSVVTDALVVERLEAAMDPRFVAQPPMRIDAAGPPEELWRDSRLARLPHDVLIAWGREDRVMPLDAALTLLRQIPRARLCVFPQCGHWVQWEHPTEWNRAVLSFLGALG